MELDGTSFGKTPEKKLVGLGLDLIPWDLIPMSIFVKIQDKFWLSKTH